MRKPSQETVASFGITAGPDAIRTLGSGLINDTYLVVTPGAEPDYVLQRINHNIFRDVEGLHENIRIVTDHIRKKLAESGVSDTSRKCLRFLSDKSSGKLYHFDGEDYWRVSEFIPDTETRETLTPENARITGIAFGDFESMLADLDVPLKETIPDFHNMEFRIWQFEEAVKADRAGRVEGVRPLIDELLSMKEDFTLPERLHREGKLPKRICHCDTKLSNILFNTDGSVACVIDLDTVMPSFIFSDYGDFLRSAANKGREDDPDLDKVEFDMEIYRSFTDGYLSTAEKFLTPLERKLLPHAPARFAYMQAIRFLTDYLDGDLYYKTEYPDHNLVRARAQHKLLRSILSNLEI